MDLFPSSSHEFNSRDVKAVLLEEIALNGLEGIGLYLLWQYVEKRIQAPITQKLKNRLWNYVIKTPHLLFYKLPEPLTRFQVVDRFSVVDEASGNLVEPEEPLDGPYEYCPVENEYGSSMYYETRLMIPNAALHVMSYDEVESEYGDHLVIVASLEQRWRALVPHLPISMLTQIMPVQYCVLELIGRGRENGQIPVGKSNITKVVKDPKLMFYNRLPLIKMDLISSASVSQVTGARAIRVQLLRLKRFHRPLIMCVPRVGKLHALIQHLKDKPNFMDSAEDIIQLKIMTSKDLKVLRKRQNMFQLSADNFETTEEEVPRKKKRIPRTVTMFPFSEESSNSDEEKEIQPVMKRRHRMGVGLLRQAYELFVEVGLKGLTQTELSQLLGIEFYASRSICKFLLTRHLLKVFIEEQGKQKVLRYVAVAVKNGVNAKYVEERKKFVQHLEIAKKNLLNSSATKVTNDDPSIVDIAGIESRIIEVDVLDGCECVATESILSSKKPPTLRLLTFANAAIDVINNRKCIFGFQRISTIVSEITKEPPLDSKIAKRCLQKLKTDKLIKLFKIIFPNNLDKQVILICSPDMELTDPIIIAKYKDICMRELSGRADKKKHKEVPSSSVFDLDHLNKYSFPRYTKLHKLHSLLVRLVHSEAGIHDPHLPPGFCSFTTILAEMPVDLALGCLRTISFSEISEANITDEVLKSKLCQCSTQVHNMLFRSGQFKNILKLLLKLLAHTGLIRLIRDSKTTPAEPQSFQNIICSSYYVNKYITIINTAGKWPRVADLEKLKMTFTFTCPKDVDNFWETLFKISMDTNVYGHRNNFKTFTAKIMDETEAVANENGELDGDGRGPCGFDSGFFLDSRHGWQNFIVRRVKTKPLPRKINKKVKRKVKKLKVKKKENRKLPKGRSKRMNPFKRATRKKQDDDEDYVPNEIKKETSPVDTCIVWTKEEDMVVVMCKAAIAIMSPKAHPGSLHVRNAVIKDILSIKDPKKTPAVCHSRAYILESSTEKNHEKDCILSELRRRSSAIQNYENLYMTLRLKYTGLSTTFFKAARTRMLELVFFISEVVKSDTYKKGSPCIAVSYKEFHEKFKMELKAENQNIYHTPDSEPKLAVLKEGIVMAIMHTFNDCLTAPLATQIHSIFKNYPEPTLRMAVDDLRKAGVLTLKERNNLQKDVTSMVKSYYKIAFAYRRRFLNRFTEDFIATTADALKEGIPKDNVKGSPAVNCIMSELVANNAVDLFIINHSMVNAPNTTLLHEEQLNVLDIGSKYKLKTGTAGWSCKSEEKLLPGQPQDLKVTDMLNSLKRLLIRKYDDVKTEDNPDNLVAYLKEKGAEGATFSELLNFYDEPYLIEKLTELCSSGITIRVGYNDNYIIHASYIATWSIRVGDQFIIPAPWINMNTDFNYEILVKWMSVIVYRVFENPGISVQTLSEACDFLNARNIQHLCQFLQEYKCVTLRIIESKEPDLFSDDDVVTVTKDFHEFESTKKMFVFPAVDTMSSYSIISNTLENLTKDSS